MAFPFGQCVVRNIPGVRAFATPGKRIVKGNTGLVTKPKSLESLFFEVNNRDLFKIMSNAMQLALVILN